MNTHTAPQAESIDRILALWKRGRTLQQIADEVGVTRQRISQRIIEAGYSPAERAALRRMAQRTDSRAYRERRALTLTAKAAAREQACDRLAALSRELGVKVMTLGAYAAKTGAYTTSRGDRTHHRWGSGVLPPRRSTEGEALARRIQDVTAPWSVMHIASLTSRRSANQ